jgi:4-amino-4-deoxy-L-arabinose transferase-like glycosyltransferase
MPAVARHRLILLVIVLVGMGIRFTYAETIGHSVNLNRFQGQLAHNILADGRWFYHNEAAERYIRALTRRRHQLVDPASIDYTGLDKSGDWVPEISESVGASLVIAGVWAVIGDERYIEVQVLQGVVDGLAALLVYWIAMQLFDRRRPAMIAAALYALYPPIAWQTASAYNDIWAIDFTIAIVALYLLAMRSDHRWRWLIACGIGAGLGVYFRPQLLLLAPALALATVFSTGQREALRRAAITTVVALLMLAPWTVRNYKDFHAFILTRSGFWVTAWNGFEETANNFGETFSEEAITAKIHRAHPDLIVDTPAWEAYVKRYVIDVIEQHPFWYLKLLVHRVAIATIWQFEREWMHIEAGHWSHYRGSIFGFVVTHPLDTLEDALEPAVFLLGMLGLGLTWRRRRQRHAMLVALVLAVLVPYIVLHVEARYLLPAVPAYLIWIGLGADCLIERVAARSRRGRVRMVVRRAAAPRSAP